ncbi:MAG TPA: baseplate J/gp47 family protein [Gemmatimonadaceae bacterium]|nr:baseplate J/gp47 family protein [Gemmatimonadaceae bacterium]
MTVSLASLILTETKAVLYQTALSIASAIGLPVSSWQAGDPSRALLHAQAEALAARDLLAAGYIRSGFLDHAEGVWLTVLAEQQFGVIVPPATRATTDVTITNPGGGFYPGLLAGDLVFKNTTTGKTYTNTTGGTLASGPGTTLKVTVIADEAGSASSASAGEIDDMVTPLGASTCTNALAAIGVDEQSEETTREQCRARRGRATPNGPKDAYTDVALDPVLTGTSAVTRCRAFPDSDYGKVIVYLAGPNGAVSAADRALVEVAILKNAAPLTITPTVLSVSNVVVPISYSMWIYKRSNKTAAEIAEAVEVALEQMFASLPIGGDIIETASTGKLYRFFIESTIREAFPDDTFRVSVSLPSGDTALTNSQVAALGVITPTIILVANPT